MHPFEKLQRAMECNELSFLCRKKYKLGLLKIEQSKEIGDAYEEWIVAQNPTVTWNDFLNSVGFSQEFIDDTRKNDSRDGLLFKELEVLTKMGW